MKKISIVIPVYNVEKYLNQCIDSIINQTISDIEIILVNDGSTDRSKSICEAYAKQDSRVIVLNQSNTGSVRARKNGVAVATGKYVGFVDSDDFIASEMYTVMYNYAEENSLDIVSVDYYNYFSEENIIEVKSPIAYGIYKNEKNKMEFYNKFFNDEITAKEYLTNSIWSKLFRREMLTQTFYEVDDRIQIGDDMAFLYPYIMSSNSFAILEEPLYYYRRIAISLSSSYYKNFSENSKLLIDHLRKLNKTHNKFDLTEGINRLFISKKFQCISNEFKADKNTSFRQSLEIIDNVCADSELRELVRQINFPVKERFNKAMIFCIKYKLYFLIKLRFILSYIIKR